MSLTLEQRDSVRRLLDELEREVKYFDLLRKRTRGYSVRELAEMEGLVPSAIRYRLRRARTEARDYLRRLSGWGRMLEGPSSPRAFDPSFL